jgi:hypothetical protein
VPSTFVRSLTHALEEAARPEIELATKVGVLLALGLNREQIAKRLGVEAVDVRLACDRLQRAAPWIAKR